MNAVRRALAAAALGVSLLAPMATFADVWKRVDEHGVTHLSDRWLGPGSVLIMRSNGRARGAPGSGQMAANRRKFASLIDKVARRYALEPALIHAVVRAESAYDHEAVSHKGAVGLMQLMPATARRYGVEDRRNPVQNLHGGVRYLRDLLAQFRNVSLALAAYNAGEGAVVKYGHKVPPYDETRRYVTKVIRFYQEHRRGS